MKFPNPRIEVQFYRNATRNKNQQKPNVIYNIKGVSRSMGLIYTMKLNA